MGFLDDLKNKASRIYDQANPFDNGRTWQQRTPIQVAPQPSPVPPPVGQPPQYQSAVHQVTHNGATNAAGSFLNNLTGIPSAIDAGRLGVAELTHNQPAIDNATLSLNKNLPRTMFVGAPLAFKQGFGQDVATAITAPAANAAAQQQADYARRIFGSTGQGDPLYQNDVDAYASALQNQMLNEHLARSGVTQDTSPAQIYKKAIGGGVSTLANMAMFAKLPGVGTATNALKVAPTYGALNATATAADMVANDPTATPKDYAKNVGLAFGMGAGLPLAVAGSRFAGNRAAAANDAYTTALNRYLASRPDIVANMSPAQLKQAGFLRMPGQKTELMVTHNLSKDNLAHADELGGIPQASVGIVDPKKYALDGFGDITLIGNQRLVDPKAPGTRTYASDVYSPRQPRGDYLADKENITAIRNELGPSLKEYGNGYLNLDHGDNLTEGLADSPAVMGHYLQSKGMKPDFTPVKSQYEQARDMRNQIIKAGKEEDYNAFVDQLVHKSGAQSRIFAGWTPSGNKRLLPETMDNVLKVMRKEGQRGADNWGGIGNIRAKVVPRFTSLQDIVKAKGRLTPTEQMDAAKEVIENRATLLRSKLDKYATDKDSNQFTEFDRQMEAISDYLSGNRQWFDSKFQNVPPAMLKELDTFKKELQEAPTEYFESVSDRGVRLSEFEKALVPEGTDPQTVALLKKHGVEPVVYKEGQRQQALQDLMAKDNAARTASRLKPEQMTGELKTLAARAKDFTDPQAFSDSLAPTERDVIRRVYRRDGATDHDAMTNFMRDAQAVPAPKKNLTSSLDAQKYPDFQSFYKDYKPFFDDNGFGAKEAESVYNTAVHEPITPIGTRGTRVSSSAQTQFEQAYNSGDMATAKKFAEQIQDPTSRQVALDSVNRTTTKKDLTQAVENPTVKAMIERAQANKAKQATPNILTDERGALGPAKPAKKPTLKDTSLAAFTGKTEKPVRTAKGNLRVKDMKVPKPTGYSGPPKPPNTKQPLGNTPLNGRKPRQFAETVKNSPHTLPESKAAIEARDTSYTPKSNKVLLAQARAAIGKDYDAAYKMATTEGSDKAVATAGELIKLHQARGEFEQVAQIADKAARNLTELGRGVQAASLYNRISPQGIVRYAAKQAGKQIAPSVAEQLTRMAEAIAKMPDGEAKAVATHQMLELARQQKTSPIAHQLIDVWKAGLLTAPTTHLGNILSNTVEALTKDLLVNPVATGIDAALHYGSFGKLKRSRSLTARGGVSGTIEGTRRAGTYTKTGYDPRNPLTKYELGNKTVFGHGPLGKAARVYTESVFRVLGAEDQPFYYKELRNSMYDRAITAAKNEGVKGAEHDAFVEHFVKEPPIEAVKGAAEDARRSVFANKTMLGQRAANLKRDSAVGSFVVPFSQVPASIATRILERSPVGVLQAANDVVRGLRHQGFDQRAFTEHLANAAVGTAGAVVVGKALSDNQMISLGYPNDQKEKARWKAERRTPYSIKMGPKWVSLNYVQPFGSILAYGAAYTQARQNGASPAQASAAAAAQAAKSVTSQSFLQGVSGTLQAIQQPEQKAADFMNSTAGSLIPNAVRSFARAQDDKQRQVNTVPDAIKNGVPSVPGVPNSWKRKSLIPQVDTYGRDIGRPAGPGARGAADSYLNPLRTSQIQGSPVQDEVNRLHATAPGDTKMDVQPTPVDRTLSIGGVKTPLNTAQQTDLQRLVGQATYTVWDSLIKTPEYQSLPDDQKVKALNNARDDATELAQRQFAVNHNIVIPDKAKLTKQQINVADGTFSAADYATKQKMTATKASLPKTPKAKTFKPKATKSTKTTTASRKRTFTDTLTSSKIALTGSLTKKAAGTKVSAPKVASSMKGRGIKAFKKGTTSKIAIKKQLRSIA